MLRRSPLRVDCTAVLTPGSCRITHSAHWRALRSNRCGKHEDEARCARRPRHCAPRRRRNRPRQVPPVARSWRGLFSESTASAAAKTGPGRTRCASEAPRSGGLMASARSTPRALTSSRLSERSERSSRSELATRPWDRAPQGSRRSRPPQRSVAACPGSALPAPTAARTAVLELQQRAVSRRTIPYL
jgi:hypothetical protein